MSDTKRKEKDTERADKQAKDPEQEIAEANEAGEFFTMD
jgi:hypothetical protein